MRRIALLAALALTACSPMPGKYGLLPGFEAPLAEDDPRIVEHPGTLSGTMGTCNGLFWDHSASGKLGVLVAGGLIFGCSWHLWTVVDGRPNLVQADVYYPEGYETIRAHERLHARGYADHPLFRF